MLGVEERLNELLPSYLMRELKRGGLAAGEEIRLRLAQRPSIIVDDKERIFSDKVIALEDISYVLDRASRSSFHAVATQLGQGYLHAGFGIRIGVCGMYSEKGMVSSRDIRSLALRLPHEMKGIGAEAIEQLRPFDSSVLIISPPGGGKTSFLRELIRKSSESGVRVCLCDERGEVAALWQGQSSFDLGPMCDILSGVEKKRGISMLLRSMNPKVIAVDEISAEYDGEAMKEAQSCGAAIYATAHGKNLEELVKRSHYRKMISDGLFQKAVIISRNEKRHYEVVDL